MAKANSDKAKEVLRDVPEKNYFRIHLGTNIGNLYELKDALTIMSDDSFKHHVTPHKNDFAVWVKKIVQDPDLATSMDKIKDREQMRDAISSRIEELEDLAVGETFSKDVRSTAMDFLMGVIVGFIIGLLVAALG